MDQDSQHNLIKIEGRATYERILSAICDLDTEEAIRQIQNFTQIFPDYAQAQNDLGTIHYQSGNLLKALAHYEKAHKLEPSNITYRKNLADFYFVELEWPDDAMRTYLEILNDNPYDIETLNALGTISQQTGRSKQARQYFEQTLRLDSSNTVALQAMQNLGSNLPAHPQLTHMSKPLPQPQSAPTVSLAEFSARDSNQNPPVLASLQSPEQLYEEALALVNSGKISDARKKLEEIISCHPDYAIAHNDLGVLFQQQSDITRSRFHHEEAVRLQPHNVLFQKNLADLLYIACGEIEEAMKLYIKILEINPKDIETLKAISHICIESGKLDDARSFLETILRIEPWNKEARDSLAEISGSEKKAQPSPPTGYNADEIYAEAQRLVQQNQLSEALSLLEELVRNNDSNALFHNDLGVLRFRRGDIDGARRAYERAVELQPATSNFRKNLADLYFAELGMVDDAINIYLDLLKKYPRDVETLAGLGQICTAVGHPEEAKSFFRRALEIEPWNREVRAALQPLP